MEDTKLLICSQDNAFCERVEHTLALWQESFCVRCTSERLEWEDLPRRKGTIRFLDLTDAGNVRHPSPEHLLIQDTATVIVFANEEQAIEAYQWHPTASLRFDFNYADFCEAMDRCFSFWRQGLQWLELPFRRELVRLPLCQLRYAEADGRETLLYCTGGVMRVSMSLGKTAEQLPSPPFLRCQKSFLVHTGAISELSGGNVVMSDGRSIPMTRDRSRELAKTVAAWNAARGMEVSVT